MEDINKINAIQRFNRLHSAIFGDISYMLKTAKISTMDSLHDHDPHFSEMVKQLEFLKNILNPLSEYLPNAVNGTVIARLSEYIGLAKNIAEAIENDCIESLGEAIAILDEKPYV